MVLCFFFNNNKKICTSISIYYLASNIFFPNSLALNIKWLNIGLKKINYV
jgi:hypothetical protein